MSRLFSWLLNGVYLTLMVLALPWIFWSAAKHGKYREGFAQKLLGRVPRRTCDRRCVWLHAVSVGEVNLLQSLLVGLSESRPDLELVISTTTKTGYELARKKYADHTVFYCPLDFSWAVNNAFSRLRQAMLVLAELELWPNLIRAAKAHGTRVAIVNGRLSDNSFCGYHRIRPLVAHLLRQLDVVAAQNDETASRFRQLGADRVTVTGSLKFDGAVTDRSNPRTQEFRTLANIADDDIVLLAGSTQAPEEQYAIDVFRALANEYPTLRLILVPRHPKRFDEVASLLDQSGVTWVRRSRLGVSEEGSVAATANDTRSTIHNPHSAVLVDSIGELGAWWGTAYIGFVGGSFGSRGGQNMLEPAAYGVATCFGPNTRNFRDIVTQLLDVEGAEVVHSRDELEQFVRRALHQPDLAEQLGKRARHLVLSQQGATDLTIKLLTSLLPTDADEQITSEAAA